MDGEGHDEAQEKAIPEKERPQESRKEVAHGRGVMGGSAGWSRCADFLVRTDDEGGIGAAGKGSAEHGIHNLHLHFAECTY